MTARPPAAQPLRLRLAAAAKADIEDVLAWSEHNFGLVARQRYEALLVCALCDVSEDAARPGLRARPELGPGVFSDHLFFSRKRAANREGRHAEGWVQRPRHLLVGRLVEPGFADIVRVLHDAMELSRHLPGQGDVPHGG